MAGYHPQEPELRRRYHDGDGAALGELWEFYRPQFESQARRQAGGDQGIADEALGRLREKLAKPKAQIRYDPARCWKNWASRILRYTIIDLLRKTNGDPQQEPENGLDSLADDDAEPPAKRLEITELGDAIDDCLDRLSPQMRESFILHFSGDRTHGEIADRLRISEGTVASRCSRARDKMRYCLSRKGYGE